MPSARSTTAPVTPIRQRAHRARKPSAKALQQNKDDDSDLETATVAAEEDASWTPRRRGARETNGTPPRAEFRRFTREYGKQRNDNITVTGSEESAGFEVAGGSEGRGTTFDELVGLILNLKETITQQFTMCS